MLLAVGAFASHGFISYWVSLAVAVASNTLGDVTDYALTRRFGTRIVRLIRLDKLGFYAELQEELKADAGITVFITRFAGSLSPIVCLLAGLVGVPYLR